MKNISKVFLIASVFLFALVLVSGVNAVNPFDIEYPISELGNCGSQNECKNYCDLPQNHDACFEYAKKIGIVSDEEVKRVEDMRRYEEEQHVMNGPGGCSSPDECDAYCKSPDRAEECLAFSVSEGYMTQEEADRILSERNKKGPGECSSREECDNFCRKPENNSECMRFAVREGHMSQEEADFMMEMMRRHKDFEDRMPHGPVGPDGPLGPGGPGGGPDDDFDDEKARELLDSGIAGPGGCDSMDSCETYCGNPGNEEECMNFAIEHGLMNAEVAEKFKKIMEQGGPGGCRGQVECDAFCSDENHQEECFEFAKEHDLIPEGELDMMEKMMNKAGPGGCKGREECDAYCNSPDHGEECIQFSVEMGMMSQEEADRMKSFIRRMDDKDRMMEMERDFGEHGPRPGDDYPRGEGDDFNRGPGFNVFGVPDTGYVPPEACKGLTPQECDKYCLDNPVECGKDIGPDGSFNRGPGFDSIGTDDHGIPDTGYVPPEACKGLTPQECDKYCFNNPVDCGKDVSRPGDGRIDPCGDDKDCGPPSTWPEPRRCGDNEYCPPPTEPREPEKCEGENCYPHEGGQYNPPTYVEPISSPDEGGYTDEIKPYPDDGYQTPPSAVDPMNETPPTPTPEEVTRATLNLLGSILEPFLYLLLY